MRHEISSPMWASVICGKEENGRDGEIRTRDHLNPIQVRYQTAPRPDDDLSYYGYPGIWNASSGDPLRSFRGQEV